MKILFINPSIRPDNPRKFYPMGLGYILSAVKRAGIAFDLHDIDLKRFTDDETAAMLRNTRYDVIAFGCLVTHYHWTKWAIGEIRRAQPQCTVVVGNSVATAIPERLLRSAGADVAVLGEGEETIVELLRALQAGRPLADVAGIAYLEDGRFVRSPARPQIADLDALPFPDREIFDIEGYLETSNFNIHEPYPRPLEEIRVLNVNTARGCLFKCSFCYHVFQGTRYRHRSSASIVAEIAELVGRYGVNYIQLWDELTFFRKKQMEEFADLILDSGLDVHWTGATIAGLLGQDDLDLARKLKRAGCLALGYSLESADPDILKMMNKKITLEGYRAQREVLRQAKIATNTSLVFGYPIETPETIRRTVDFVIDLKLSPSAGFVLPQPGTPIYDLCLEKGLIVDEEEYLSRFGDRQDMHVNLTGMTDEELRTQVGEGVKRYQEALGIKMDNPMKTLRKRSRDAI